MGPGTRGLRSCPEFWLRGTWSAQGMGVALSWGFGNVERTGLSGVGGGRATGPEPGSSSAHCLELGFSSAFQLGSSERPSTLSPVGMEARFAPQVLTPKSPWLVRGPRSLSRRLD